MVTELRILYII